MLPIVSLQALLENFPFSISIERVLLLLFAPLEDASFAPIGLALKQWIRPFFLSCSCTLNQRHILLRASYISILMVIKLVNQVYYLGHFQT